MPCVKRKLFALAMFAVLVFFPHESFAATSCECFCGAPGSGAVSADTSTKEQCKETCDALSGNWQYVGCFTDPAQYPVESDKCWTKGECEAWSDERSGGEVVSADWGTVFPADCAKTKTSQEPMHYCYANDVPYDLNIAFGNVTEVENLPDYINTVYTWLLPAAALVAVVMMMLGGLQYTLARGKAKYIDKAKTRITNAITGMVILLSAFVILNLIDPRLVSFDALKIPLIKEVTILDATSSCERLADYGYTIGPVEAILDSDYKKCGGHGTITDVSGLKENALGSWKVNDPCSYMYCADGESCVDDDGDSACYSCSEIPEETASSATCALIEEFDSGPSGETQIYCQYDAKLRSCITAGNALSVTQGFYCGQIETDADALIKVESTASTGCSVYNTLDLGYSSSVKEITDEKGKELLQRICEEDKCGVRSIFAKYGYEGIVCSYDELTGCSLVIE